MIEFLIRLYNLDQSIKAFIVGVAFIIIPLWIVWMATIIRFCLNILRGKHPYS